MTSPKEFNHSKVRIGSPAGVNLQASSSVVHGLSELFLPGGTNP